MTDLEQQLTDHLRRRAAAAAPRYDLEGIEQDTSLVSVLDLDDRRSRPPTIRLLAIAACVLAVIALATVVMAERRSVSTISPSESPPTESSTVHGSFEIIDAASGSSTPATPCSGEGAYDDINSSTPVVLRDSTGGVLARTTLGPGETLGPTECGFKFALEVPEGADTYVASVGDRGEVSYTFDDLKRRGITLTVGGQLPGARELP